MSRHTSPRRILSATPEQWAAWDEAAKAHGQRWSTWARAMLDLHVKVMIVCSAQRGEFRCTLERGHRGPHYTGPLRDGFEFRELDDDENADIHTNGYADIRSPRRLLP
jgi:hypothetical protein